MLSEVITILLDAYEEALDLVPIIFEVAKILGDLERCSLVCVRVGDARSYWTYSYRIRLPENEVPNSPHGGWTVGLSYSLCNSAILEGLPKGSH